MTALAAAGRARSPAMHGYPRGFGLLLPLVGALLTASGVLLLPGSLLRRFGLQVPLQLPDGWGIGCAAAHALGAFAALLVLGMLWAIHIRIGWRSRRQLGSGLCALALLLAMAVSALGIYYLGDERWSNASAAMHLGAAALFAVAMSLHAIGGRRAHARRVRPH